MHYICNTLPGGGQNCFIGGLLELLDPVAKHDSIQHKITNALQNAIYTSQQIKMIYCM